MERVLIIGCGGAGKSTLARQLGEKTGLPVIHLDQIFWSPGSWQHMERPAFDRAVRMEMQRPKWILDGNYDRTVQERLELCDTVIYLDYPRLVCLLSWLKRVMTYRGKSRPDMGPDCAEWLDPNFVKWIWNFNREHRKAYYAMLKDHPQKQIHIFKNRRQLRRFLQTL